VSEGAKDRPLRHSDDPLLDAALEAARLLTVAMKTMRGEPEPAFASKVTHTVQRIYDIEAARTHEG
jgi:hypothetical protein